MSGMLSRTLILKTQLTYPNPKILNLSNPLCYRALTTPVEPSLDANLKPNNPILSRKEKPSHVKFADKTNRTNYLRSENKTIKQQFIKKPLNFDMPT